MAGEQPRDDKAEEAAPSRAATHAGHAPPWPRRIGTRLTAVVAVTTFGCFVIAVLLGLEVQQRHLVRQAVEGASLFGDSITRATHDQMLRGRKDEAYKVIREVGRLERIEKVRLFNKDGKVTFSTATPEVGSIFPKSAEFCNSCHGTPDPVVKPETTQRSRIFRSDDHRVLGFIVPIYNEPACAGAGCHASNQAQRVLGVVDVEVSLAQVDAEMATLRWRTLGIGLIGTLALTAFLLQATRRFILKPVRALVAATREIARGNLDLPVRHRSDDELGLLAESFDGMRVSLRDAQGEIQTLMAGLEKQVEDRTAALKRAQVQLIQGEKLASLGKLSASIAHEINNPLAGILTFSKLLARDLEQDVIDAATREEALKRLKLVQRETERCSAIVRNLLDFARQRPPDLRDVDVRAALDESLHLVGHQIELLGITLDKAIDGHPVVRADFGQLRQALVNILLNAIEAMPRGGTLAVSLSLPAGSDDVVVAIRDSGVGIDDEHLNRIFDPFFTTKERGTGLGLSVVYGIVENIGGKLEVESRVGVGTTVRIRIPSSTETAPAAGTGPASGAARGGVT